MTYRQEALELILHLLRAYRNHLEECNAKPCTDNLIAIKSKESLYLGPIYKLVSQIDAEEIKL